MIKKKRKVFRIIWFTLVGIFLIWNFTTFQSRDLPADTFKNEQKVSVIENKDEITFEARSPNKTSEIIFFQGGLTDPKAYAPLCRKFAENGYTCHLIKMAWRLPQNDYKKISKMFNFKTGKYIIGGHSQGAKMAAQFVYENPTKLNGLFLIGTSHPRDIDMSQLKIPTIKLYAENDGLASVDEVIENKEMLPQNTNLIMIKGGNHSQFGYLGQLLTDNSPAISLEKQQGKTLDYLLKFFSTINNGT